MQKTDIVQNQHKKIYNNFTCCNPNCVTTKESDLKQMFTLRDKQRGIYRCKYCENKIKI